MAPCFSFGDKTERREMGVKPWERRWRAQGVLHGVALRGEHGSTVHMAIFSSIGIWFV